MGYVFISHASEDKRKRVRPLVEALAMQGIKLWIDRPGYGDSHFDFDQDFIDRYGIKSLTSGLTWDAQIAVAIREAGAVLACLSRALCSSRQVLAQELLLAKYEHKLVACIIDDLPFTEIPSDLGLVDPSKIQAERIDSELLQAAIDQLKESTSLAPDKLSPDHKKQWEIVRKLVNDINQILDRSGLRTPGNEELEATLEKLALFPTSPKVNFYNIPQAIIDSFTDRFDEPAKAQRFFDLAMRLARQGHSLDYTDNQVIVTKGEIVNPNTNPLNQYWEDVLSIAGHRSRRTLAALLLAPGAPTPSKPDSERDSALTGFLEWLRNPNS